MLQPCPHSSHWQRSHMLHASVELFPLRTCSLGMLHGARPLMHGAAYMLVLGQKSTHTPVQLVLCGPQHC